MDKGKGVKGRESALWVRAVPGLRPGTFSQVCFRAFARLSFALLQELSKELVIEFVATASRSYQQSFIA
jgi:hypothetical protein